MAVVRSRFPDVLILPSGMSEDEIASTCSDTEIISTFVSVPFSANLLKRLPALKLLCTRSVGFDHIDLHACKTQGIVVCHVPDYGAHVIAEHVFALLLGTLRHISVGHERVKAGRFEYHGLRGTALKGKTIGIIGTGKIGKQTAKIAHGFGMRLLGFDPYPAHALTDELGLRYLPLEELLAQSDVITLHAPAMKENWHMLNEQTFACVKRGAILVNTARGAIVDDKALLKALENGTVSWALLDVLEHEGKTKDNMHLINHPHVVVTPHIAFYADDSMKAMFDDCFVSIDQWKDGRRPEHAVS